MIKIVVVTILTILFACILIGCASDVPIPTVTPIPTPATAQERYDVYWEELQILLARLKRDILDIDGARENKTESFLIGLSVGGSMLSIADMSVPTDKDLQSLGYTPGLLLQHQALLSILRPCGQVGALAMEMETVPLKDLLAAQEACKKMILGLEEKDTLYVKLFRCPYDHPLCK